MADAKRFREIAEEIREECGNFSPFAFLAWLNEYFIRTPAFTREEQHALDLVKGQKYLN